MKYLPILFSLVWIMTSQLSDPSWVFGPNPPLASAAMPFDEVVKSPHNLIPPDPAAEGYHAVCSACHTDGRFSTQADETPTEAQSASDQGQDIRPGAAPLWGPRNGEKSFFLLSGRWESPDFEGPYGSSSACLGCHDGALALDVHGGAHRRSQDRSSQWNERMPIDHPTAVVYPRHPDGTFAYERPIPTAKRYWAIADRTDQGIAIPTGPVSDFFPTPSGIDPQDPSATANLVRTSYGVVHCDSCHNPHVNRHRPFLRTTPKELCFVCHDR